jgi:hypothetical protein
LTTFYKVNFSYLEPVTSIATVEGESPDDVVNKIRDYFSHVKNLEVHEVTLLEEAHSKAPPSVGKPTLRVVN